jgi:ribosomal protein S18 acetylase RimI-like enzyme
MKSAFIAVVRFLRGLRRPSKVTNSRLLRERGEEAATSFVFRDATVADIPALARLHVTAWNATYPGFRSPPTYELRERQWREAFAMTDGSWFCFVIENQRGELVGFAKGMRYAHPDQPDYSGELSKIYLLPEYQRLALGRRLVGHTARRFLAQGISTMLLFADAGNPSCRFFEALGAERLCDPNGKVSYGNYGWRDLRTLASMCPIDGEQHRANGLRLPNDIRILST